MTGQSVDHIYVIVRMQAPESATSARATSIHSVWPDAGAALRGREEIHAGGDLADVGAYTYEVVRVAIGERLDSVVLWERVKYPPTATD